MSILRIGIFLALFCASGTAAQTPDSVARDSTTELFLGVSPQEVTVGDRFQVVVRVDPPDGVAAEYPDITGGDTIQSLEPVRITTTAAGDTVAVYTLVAWIAGQPLSATIPVRLRSTAGVSELPVALRLPTVVSVLPAGDTIVEPRPAKPLIVPSLLGEAASFWPYLLLAAVIAGILGFWLLDRRRGVENEQHGDPRVWALAQLALLDETPAATLEQRAERYRRASRILRLYIARVDPERGLDLTTSELVASLRGILGPGVVESLARLLELADRVKFARLRPTEVEATLLIDDARAFVGLFPGSEGSADTQPTGRAA